MRNSFIDASAELVRLFFLSFLRDSALNLFFNPPNTVLIEASVTCLSRNF